MALVVLTGGARSGKSRAAEALGRGRLTDGVSVAVAVFGRAIDDEEWAQRIAAHRSARPREFATFEVDGRDSWHEAVAFDGLLLVDCLGTLLGQCMDDAWREPASTADGADDDPWKTGVARNVEDAFMEAVESLLARTGDTVVVTNEVGDGIIPEYASGRLFRDLLGRANRVMVDHADAAYLVVAGRLIDLATLPRSATWPTD